MFTILLTVFAIFLEIFLAWFLWRIFFLRYAQEREALEDARARVENVCVCMEDVLDRVEDVEHCVHSYAVNVQEVLAVTANNAQGTCASCESKKTPIADMNAVYRQLMAVDKRVTDTAKHVQGLKRTVDRREHWHGRKHSSS